VCVQRLREEWYDRVLARKAALRRQLEELQLPGNPLDMIIQAMGGPSKVAESEW
jgi:Lhr-like helicase